MKRTMMIAIVCRWTPVLCSGLFLSGCSFTSDSDHSSSEITYLDISTYPDTYPELETDVAYFQGSTLILYSKADHSETNLATASERPNNLFWSSSGRTAFYHSSFWVFHSTDYRFDRKTQREELLPLEVYSRSMISPVGDKILGIYSAVSKKPSYFNANSRQILNLDSSLKVHLNDTSLILSMIEYEWIDNHTFKTYLTKKKATDSILTHWVSTFSDDGGPLRVVDINSSVKREFSPSSSDYTYNNDSSYYFYLKQYGGVEYFGGATLRCFVVNTKTQETTRLMPEANDLRSIAFTPSGKHLVFTAWVYNKKKEYTSYIFVSKADGSSISLISRRDRASAYCAIVNPNYTGSAQQ